VNPWPRPDFKELDLEHILLNSQEFLSLVPAVAPGRAWTCERVQLFFYADLCASAI